MMPNKQNEISAHVLKQIQLSLHELLREPLQPYSIIGLEIHVHDGSVKRIKTKRESQIAIDERETNMT